MFFLLGKRKSMIGWKKRDEKAEWWLRFQTELLFACSPSFGSCYLSSICSSERLFKYILTLYFHLSCGINGNPENWFVFVLCRVLGSRICSGCEMGTVSDTWEIKAFRFSRRHFEMKRHSSRLKHTSEKKTVRTNKTTDSKSFGSFYIRI